MVEVADVFQGTSLATNRRLKCLQSTFGGDIYSFHIINRTFKAKLSFPTLSP